MFRAAAPGPFDEAVGKATDENATSEDWAAILEVCDRVSSDATNGPKDAVQSLIKRLAHRNANVQLYTLELANALSQNCGTPLHRELASRAFTDALLKLANDRNTHNLVRLKILERMKEWAEMFKSNTDLGIMQDAYNRLQQAQPQLQLAPPSAPQKNSLTELDHQREEEDLQRALKLSLEDEGDKRMAAPGGAAAAPSAAGPSGHASAPGQAGPSSAYGGPGGPGAGGVSSEAPTPTPQGTTAATVSRVRALFDFAASEPDELDFKKGDVIAVLESVYRDWWRGSLKGRTGIFPLNYVEILADPTPDELQREAMMESEVFAEIKNVEKLLTLLSASNTVPREEDTDEISTLAIRPKLIKLIEKYSQKKDDFTQLNEKFIKARRDYEALLESSMAHPPQPNYQQYAMHQQQQIPPQGYPGPGAPGGPAPAHAGYQAPGLAQQPDRYYTPGPQQRQGAAPHGPGPNPNVINNQTYLPYNPHQNSAPSQPQAPQQAPPPPPQQQAPPIPQPVSSPPLPFTASPPPASLAVGSPPLGPSQQGGFYDARQHLPSRASGSAPSAPLAPTPVSAAGSPSPPAQFQQQQQYRPYVPPTDNTNQQGTVDDYYRQTGRVGYQ
ncbi:class e vacuolar protein-sorting machinery protein hse1 [Ophiostoma piceae UAMH 11346]|uniref:Class E vacuolar protein-sorting machinery protein HSE1 n=1 Tax=Ophiostoma piceae (strain UAMH 11346) TaxID=1262450 RepID=S3BZV8_OPHP1|nr:class e vacuolar protein-sorting machinery protein hse1 [Ophiostoma piceae UAMH 11346]